MTLGDGVRRAVLCGVLLYTILLLILLYLLRFSVLALLINPPSIVAFIIGMALIVYLVGAVPMGIVFLRNSSLGKLTYIALAAFLVVGGLVVLALQ